MLIFVEGFFCLEKGLSESFPQLLRFLWCFAVRLEIHWQICPFCWLFQGRLYLVSNFFAVSLTIASSALSFFTLLAEALEMIAKARKRLWNLRITLNRRIPLTIFLLMKPWNLIFDPLNFLSNILEIFYCWRFGGKDSSKLAETLIKSFLYILASLWIKVDKVGTKIKFQLKIFIKTDVIGIRQWLDPFL